MFVRHAKLVSASHLLGDLHVVYQECVGRCLRPVLSAHTPAGLRLGPVPAAITNAELRRAPLTHPVFAALDHPLFVCGGKRMNTNYLLLLNIVIKD
jgi:hypothetical protein